MNTIIEVGNSNILEKVDLVMVESNNQGCGMAIINVNMETIQFNIYRQQILCALENYKSIVEAEPKKFESHILLLNSIRHLIETN